MGNATLFEIEEPALKGALFSECGRYRYTLLRRWAAGPILYVVMLNPSTADAEDDDPTIRKVVGFAKLNGFAAIEVRNLYAWRSPTPSAIDKTHGVGPDNDEHIRNIPIGTTVLVAWGTHPYITAEGTKRVDKVLSMLNGRRKVCVRRSGNLPGRPWHPLYVKYGMFERYDG